MSGRLGDALRVLAASPTGRAGIALLLALLAVSVYALATYRLDFGTRLWSNPAVWADNPRSAPPAWTSAFSGGRQAAHRTLHATAPTGVQAAPAGRLLVYRLAVEHRAEAFPTFLSFALGEVTFGGRPPVVTLELERPDGGVVTLLRHAVPGRREGEALPAQRYFETPFRVLVDTDAAALDSVADFLNGRYGTAYSGHDLRDAGARAAFGVPVAGRPGEFSPLRGEYRLVVGISAPSDGDSVGWVRVVVGGTLFGVMGTDSQGRDLAVGLLFGFPVALSIGLLASTLTTAIGTALGIASGYWGGWVDSAIQRGADVVANIPLLPILIFMVFVLGPHLPLIIFVLVAFSWPGLAILVRSMVLQMRSGQLVEAALALGASRWRIMSRHIFPQTAPYVFAQMVFFTPAAILAEAGLSFLGLGDPSIPTWGQILEQGFRTGAVYVGYWWWVLPPGLLIVVTAMAFVLLALGLEPVVNPRLRGMR